MYDILQLNDMLVPELVDIAAELKIANAQQLDKQALIYKILDKQAILESAAANGKGAAEKPRRKRIVKASTAHVTEEAEVMVETKPEIPAAAPDAAPSPEETAPGKRAKAAKGKAPAKKGKGGTPSGGDYPARFARRTSRGNPCHYPAAGK